MIKYLAEFEGHLKAQAGSGQSVNIIKSLNAVSKYLGINISPNNLGSGEDIKAYMQTLTQSGRTPPHVLKQYQAAMQCYVDMVNGL